jgi:Tfp pilus assembly protein PilE
MGQQQLLLVILVTIIVGIATVVAINTFGGAADSANLDAVRQDVASVAAAAQGFFMKPTMLGGGGNDFDGITFNTMAFAADSVSSDGLSAINSNGLYVITAPGASSTSFTLTAHPASRITGAMTFTNTASEGEAELVASISEGGVSYTDNQ